MMKKSFFSLLALVLAAGSAYAGGGNAISISSGEAGIGGSVSLSVNADTADTVAGWSWGVGHDGASLSLVEAVDGATTLTVNNGNPPDFNQLNVVGTDGWTVGVVISFIGTASLAPGAGYEMNVATYTNDALGAGATSDVCFTDLLGSPPVATVLVVSGQSVTPDQSCGTVTGAAADPFIYSVTGAADVSIDAASTSAICSILDEASPARDTQGFSMGLANDGALLNPTGLTQLGELAALNGGSGPDFFGENLLGSGWTVGVVYAFVGGSFIQFDVAKDVIEANYDIIGAPADGDVTDLTWSNDLGSPPVANVIVVDGQSEDASLENGSINFVEITIPSVTFLRGDANDDSIVNIADGVFVIGTLFYGYTATCAAALDANADGLADLSDAMFIIDWRFLDGPAPSFPFPDCGESFELGDVDLGCAASSCP
ncbi:MAG: hypothetical protein AAF488_10450 [Planctomycetota bacterium]